jgi:hypothetical protein
LLLVVVQGQRVGGSFWIVRGCCCCILPGHKAAVSKQ